MKKFRVLARPHFVLSLTFLAILATFSFTVVPESVEAADEENCLMCHKHRGMGRIDISGNRRIFYVNEGYFAKSVHGRVPCRGCHTNITQIPHQIHVKKVNCGTQCHKKEPSSGNDFSHRPLYINYKRSVHSTDLTNPEPGKPVCKYCHRNPLYSRTTRGREKPIERIVDRCTACHTTREWSHTFYMHVEHRLMKRTMRSRLQVVELCGSCHADEKMLLSKGVHAKSAKAFRTYQKTYHYRALILGRQDVADCVDCHSYYEPYSPHNVHLILRTTDPDSAVHPDNKGKICGQDACHDERWPGGVRATPELAEMNMHADFDDPDSALIEFILWEVYFFLMFGVLAPLAVWIFMECLRRLI
jgi:hypothetical protein